MPRLKEKNQRWWASGSSLVEESPCWSRPEIDSPQTQNCSALSLWPHGYGPIVYGPFENLGDSTRGIPSPQRLVMSPSIGLEIYP
ncbi:unnamed protein product, partial [Arabidopsis halleri]